MKKAITFLCILSLLLSTFSADAASIWTKYTASDKGYSFHYPSGWKVTADASIVDINCTKTDEQMIMTMLPFDKMMSPQDLAEKFIVLLKSGNPKVTASNWKSLAGTSDEQVIFDLSDKIGGKEYSGLGIVIKSNQQAIWFSYFAPASDYYRIRGNNLLQGFIGSFASGTVSKAPKINYKVNVSGKIDSDARAFLFVLEFTLGAPFTKSQEDVILKELKDGWRYLSEEELKGYDQYPTLVKAILKMKQKDLEELRSELEKSIDEWMSESDSSDPAVKIINSTLKSKGKVVIDGEPPLTEMSLTAYSEIITYSRLLQKDKAAKLDQISQKTVNSIKKQVKKEWNSFSSDSKKGIATSPGLWICLRTQLRYGTTTAKEEIKESLTKLGTATEVTGSDNNTDSGSDSIAVSGTEFIGSLWSTAQVQQSMLNGYLMTNFNYQPTSAAIW